MREEILLRYLKSACLGKENAVKCRELCAMLHIGGTDLRKLVSRLRRKGVPVAATRDGYFYAKTAHEVYDAIRQLTKLRDGVNAAIVGLESALNGFEK